MYVSMKNTPATVGDSPQDPRSSLINGVATVSAIVSYDTIHQCLVPSSPNFTGLPCSVSAEIVGENIKETNPICGRLLTFATDEHATNFVGPRSQFGNL